MDTTTLIYITHTRKSAANKILRDAGYQRPPANPHEMVMMLQDYIEIGGEEAIRKIMEIHPDRDLFVKALPPHADGVNPAVIVADSPLFGCDACKDKLNCIAADASIPGQPGVKGLSDRSINLMIISGAVLFTAALVTVIIVNKN
jgi:hypothetical protein